METAYLDEVIVRCSSCNCNTRYPGAVMLVGMQQCEHCSHPVTEHAAYEPCGTSSPIPCPCRKDHAA